MIDNQFQSTMVIIELMKRDAVQTDKSFDYIHLNTTHNPPLSYLCVRILVDAKVLARIHSSSGLSEQLA